MSDKEEGPETKKTRLDSDASVELRLVDRKWHTSEARDASKNSFKLLQFNTLADGKNNTFIFHSILLSY